MRSIENAMHNLMSDRELLYFYVFIYKMKVNWVKGLNTLGVGVKDQRINLTIDEDWWEKRTVEEQSALLQHEVMHLMNGHITRYPKSSNIINIAADCAINQYIEGLPAGGVTLELMQNLLDQTGINKKVKPYETTEYYLELLNKIKEELQDQLQQTDSHENWDGNDSDCSGMTEEIIKNTVSEAKKEVEAQRGTIPNYLETMINNYLKSKVNWKQKLRRFVENARESITEETRKKRNRRFGLLQPGFRKLDKLKLALAIDTSGSVDDSCLEQFAAEIDAISHNNVEFYIIESDAEVHNVYKYEKKSDLKFKGRGGTAYQPALDKASELDIDGLIYFGDMECESNLIKPKYPVMWAIVGNARPPASWGWEVRIE